MPSSSTSETASSVIMMQAVVQLIDYQGDGSGGSDGVKARKNDMRIVFDT